MLHITNGDAAADLICQSAVPGEVLPWRDVLHDGPVPAGLALEELSRVRAGFIIGEGWGTEADVRRQFETRDRALAGAAEHEEVILWFEHDLYDQLQMLQVLDWFAGPRPRPRQLSLICVGAHPAVQDFHGLGQLEPAHAAVLFEVRPAVSRHQLELAQSAWAAFCAPDPSGLERIAQGDTGSLQYLAAALRRHLEDFPSVMSGLGRSERQILQALAPAPSTFGALFRACAGMEEAQFMGDASLWSRLRALLNAREPALALVGQSGPGRLPARPEAGLEFTLTEFGKQVHQGRADFVRANGVDRWLGGVHLTGGDAAWRWDGAWECLVAGAPR